MEDTKCIFERTFEPRWPVSKSHFLPPAWIKLNPTWFCPQNRLSCEDTNTDIAFPSWVCWDHHVQLDSLKNDT